ncbi:Hypothetical predicted protein [Mytilus galloprovincialis]|uniref:Apple domain-containing protein n=1 Tax=Mytilus galloprovincialis TaxID=29158 RepID=A0A8B6BGE6_MYTGA|nr:Hypothetical predicted protein [Mytilus galloprovincialis]
MGDPHLLIALGVISTANIVFANIPTRLWPLDNSTFTAEIQGPSTDPIDTGQCGRIFGGQPPDYPNPVIELDGTTPVDLVVDATIDSDKDYSFSMMVRPTNDTGALLHYKPDDSTQQLKELAFYISEGYIHMDRILNTGIEISPQSTELQLTINTWNYISFGIDRSNGKMIINFNDIKKQHDNSSFGNVDFVIPGILRVGGMFDQRKSNLQGRVACVAFYSDVKEPKQSDSEPTCKADIGMNNEPDCSTPQAIQRSETAAGYFMMETNIQLSTLNQISTIPKCTKLQCAVSCLRHQSCWYYRYEPSASGCSQCTLYDSSVTFWKGTGAGDNFLYKWK